MSMFGIDIKIEFERQIFKNYSVFYNTTKQNNLFRKAIVSVLEDKYRNLVEQKDFDDLGGVIKLNKNFQLNNNSIYISPLSITTITKLGTTFLFNFGGLPHNVKVGDMVFFTGIQGTLTFSSLNSLPFIVQGAFFGEFAFSITSSATGLHTPNTGAITSHYENNGSIPKMSPDYNHLLAVKAKFEQVLPYGVSDVTNTQPITLVLDTINNNIVSKEQLTLSGILSNTNANGTFYAQKVNRKTLNLFADKDLSKPTLGNGNYQGQAVIKRLFYNYAIPLISTEKISNYDDATTERPAFERGDKMIKIAPYDYDCLEISMDYISDAVVFIDVTNSVIDLENTYPAEFLYYVIAKAVQLYGQEVNDSQKYQAASAEIQKDQ